MRVLLALAAVLLAGGCINAGEPSEDDIRGALTQAGNRGGPKAVKLACKRGTDKPGFVCDYRAPACNRFTNACGSPKPGSGRFVKSGGRWQLVEDLTPRAGDAPGTQPLPDPGITPSATPTGAPTGPGITFSPIPTASPVPTFSPEPAPPRPAPPEWDDEADTRPALKPRDLSMIARWVGLNARCQIGEGASDDARDACFERDDLAQRMRRRGLCYGGGGRDTVAKWHRCD